MNTMLRRELLLRLLAAAALFTGSATLRVQAQDNPPPPAEVPRPAQKRTPPAADQKAPAAAAPAVRNGADEERNLRLNFRGVPLDMVLSYLSDAAGFIIILDTEVK